MADRDRQHAVLSLHRHDPVDEGPADRVIGHKAAGEGSAVEQRRGRTDLAARGAQREIDQLLGASQEIRVRELLEQDREIGRRHALGREMTVKVVFGADHAVRPHDVARPRQKIALAIVIAVGDHRAVQAEQRDVDWKRGAKLRQDFVTQAFKRRTGDPARRLRPGGGALDQVEAVQARATPGGDDRRRAQGRRFGVATGRRVEITLEIRAIDRQWREGVRLGREGGHEHSHQSPPRRLRLRHQSNHIMERSLSQNFEQSKICCQLKLPSSTAVLQ